MNAWPVSIFVNHFLKAKLSKNDTNILLCHNCSLLLGCNFFLAQCSGNHFAGLIINHTHEIAPYLLLQSCLLSILLSFICTADLNYVSLLFFFT